MGKYRILEPVHVQKGNKVTIYSKSQDEAVNIDDDVAKKLGDKVKAVGSEEESKPDNKADATPSQQASNAAQTSQKGAAK